eukprot:TRINITY_DN236_c0_g1_i4.p1 TRINITY_DN236_c0_g1~~TRINITY_DN236_c0_g1_i4.p1  ORF type:complete len:1103 (-),score=195.73 TRINITY_DN236_c0_g1_i4:4688-7939(-)
MGNQAPRPLRGTGTRIEEDIASIKHLEVSYSSVKYVDQDTPFNENKSLSCHAVTIGKSKQKQALKLYKDPVDPKTFWMEVLFLRRLHHPNVANLKGHIFSDNHSGVIVEYSDYGTLFDLLHMDRFKQFRPLPLELQLHFAKEIALGLDYLRGLGVIHKRLRSSNIVVKSLDLAPGNHVILSDFGASMQETDHDTLSFAPTAPATSQFASYFNTLDVYAFGILLWEITTCELPLTYSPKVDPDSNGSAQPLPEIPPSCPRELANIMKLCWHPDPNQRLGLVEVLDALLCIEEKYIHHASAVPTSAKLGAMSIGYRNQRTRLARLERLGKLIRFCEEVASKNVDVTDLLIVLSESTIALQALKFVSNDDLRKFDALVDEYETVLPIEVGSAKDQQSFWAKFNSKKKSRAAIEKLNGRMQQMITALQQASETALTAAVSSYEITENVDKIMTTAIPNFVRAPRTVLGQAGISSMMNAPSHRQDALEESSMGGGGGAANTASVDDDGEHYVRFETLTDTNAPQVNTISGESATPLPLPLLDDADIPTRVIHTRPQVGRIVVIPTRAGRSNSTAPQGPSSPVERSTSSTGGTYGGGDISGEESSSVSDTIRTPPDSSVSHSASSMITEAGSQSTSVEPLSPRHYSLISPRRPRTNSVSVTPLALQRRNSTVDPPMRSARVSLIDELEAAMLDILETPVSTTAVQNKRTLSPSASVAPQDSPSSPSAVAAKPATIAAIAEEPEESSSSSSSSSSESDDDSSSSSDSDSDTNDSSSSTKSAGDDQGSIDTLLTRIKTAVNPSRRLDELSWDPSAKSFWVNNFGPQSASVEWNQFINAYAIAVQGGDNSAPVSQSDRDTLKKILDHNNAGYVTIHTFTQFLHGHGPLARSLSKVKSYTTQPWFHWYLDHDESTILMKHNPARTFVVRFSKSNPGFFALTIKLENGTTEKWLVESRHGKVRAAFAQPDLPSFDTIDDFVQYYKSKGFVRTPLTQPWTSAPWFLGLTDGAETIRLLQGHPVGTYLVRLSGNGDYLVCAYVLSEGIVQEKVLWPEPNRFIVENWEGSKEYKCADVAEFVKMRPDRLLVPFAGAQ